MENDDLKTIELVFDAETASATRVDQFISLSVDSISRAQAQRLIDEDSVSINGKSAKSSQKLRHGDRVSLRILAPKQLTLEPEDIPLNVVHEDEHLIVVYKPAGMVTHPGAGVSSGTLVNALLHHCRGQLAGIGGVERPGIVHRLDKDTAGLMVVAKEGEAHKLLSEQIANREVRRQYTALLDGQGLSESGTVDRPIGRHPLNRKQMAIVLNGRDAVTHYQVLERFFGFILIEARLQTGRTHQIRVHMSSLGFPVVGDLVYNRRKSGTEKFRGKLGVNGQCLYATKLTFTHPISGKLLEFEVAPPPEFQQALSLLKR